MVERREGGTERWRKGEIQILGGDFCSSEDERDGVESKYIFRDFRCVV